MEFLRDLGGFLIARKKYWLLPVIITLLLFGVLIVFSGGSAISPFIYTIFLNNTYVGSNPGPVGLLP